MFKIVVIHTYIYLIALICFNFIDVALFSVRLPRWHDSNRLRGYGHVEFSCKSAAEEALDMDGFYIDKKRFVKVTKPMVPRAMINAKMHNKLINK